jgi:hypothetical protein
MMKKLGFTIFAGAVLALPLCAQEPIVGANVPVERSGETPTGPINFITRVQYEQLVQAGVQLFPITPDVILRQDLQTFLTYLKNEEIVENFIAGHPNLSGLTQLYGPATNPAAVPTSDGNYLIQNPDVDGGSQTVETMGPATMIADVATRIQVSSDPVQQLALYQSVYSGYTALYDQLCWSVSISPSTSVGNGGCVNLTPPSSLVSPSLLAQASLGAIKGALHSVASQGAAIYKIRPFPPVTLDSPVAPSCSGISAKIYR